MTDQLTKYNTSDEIGFDIKAEMPVEPFKGVVFEPVANNPGTRFGLQTKTVWVNSADGHLYRGTTDVEAGGAGTGDVVGPTGALDNGLVLFDGTTGKLIQGNSVTISQSGTTNLNILIDSVPFLYSDEVSANLALGTHSGGAGIIGTTSNTLIGKRAGSQIVGDSNVAIGHEALSGVMTGNWNVAVGTAAMQDCTAATNCTAVGMSSLRMATTAQNCTAIGSASLENLTTGLDNTAVGNNTGANLSTGQFNVLLGSYCGTRLTTASGNVAVGRSSLQNLLTGTGNVCIGNNAGNLFTGAETNNIIIGSAGTLGDNATIRIGSNAEQTKTHIAGISGITTAGAAVPVLVDADGQLGTTSSSRTVKQDIRPAEDTSYIHQLSIVNFAYIAAPERKQIGVIAEDVELLKPEIVIEQANGIKTVDYNYLFVSALKEIQELRKEVTVLKKLAGFSSL